MLPLKSRTSSPLQFYQCFLFFPYFLYSITVSKTASGSVTSELTLDKVQWEDEGIYSCLAKQVASKDEPTKQEIILEIFGKLISDLKISNSAVRRFILSFNNPEITLRNLHYLWNCNFCISCNIYGKF